MISEEVIDKLNRMRAINTLIRGDEEYAFDDKLMAEYIALKDEMVELFMPIVNSLCKAGLLTVFIEEVDQIPDLDTYSSLTGEPVDVFDNGNIWIASEYSGGTCLQNKSRKIRICNENIWDR